jgi:hypothetical protein
MQVHETCWPRCQLLLLQEQPDRAHKAIPPTGVLQDPKGAKLEIQQATGATH